jgi:protein-S-isoprenylcysteine O-methyltransferase Ste14
MAVPVARRPESTDMTGLLRHLLAIAVLPLTVTVLVPVWIARRFGVGLALGSSAGEVALQLLGIAVFGVGLLLFLASLRRFATEGKGTLAPWDPPRELVVRGPYRFVRNPMISGVVFLLWGEALVLLSVPHGVWAGAFLALNLVYIPLVEEPQLERRFGEPYREYRRHVRRFLPRLRPWVPVLLCCAGLSAGGARAADIDLSLLAPPDGPRPLVVHAGFEFHDVNEINDEAETFDFTGVLTLRWRDPRVAFDPAATGANELIFQGGYQFDEIATGWYPQVVVVNEAEATQTSGIALRVQPDGTSTLIQTLTGTAEVELDMRRLPFDRHHLTIVFAPLGFGVDELVLQAESNVAGSMPGTRRIPQWSITGSGTANGEREAIHAGHRRVSSVFIASLDVQRQPFHLLRLVVLPLIVIVLLSFSVFWMDRSSLGDRTSVSFIGILTGVAYQMLIDDSMPRISYTTLMHGFLGVSLLTMCATVLVNLRVGSLDKQGHQQAGDRLDRRCRWAFPLVYFGLLVLIVVVAFLLL